MGVSLLWQSPTSPVASSSNPQTHQGQREHPSHLPASVPVAGVVLPTTSEAGTHVCFLLPAAPLRSLFLRVSSHFLVPVWLVGGIICPSFPVNFP